jgi:hypothetical protein
MNEKIKLTHPAGKKAVSMDKGKYDAVKRPLLDRLAMGESTHTEILHAITEDFSRNKTKFDGSVEWHMEWVKLDLEAKHEIKRLGGTSPIRFALG